MLLNKATEDFALLCDVPEIHEALLAAIRLKDSSLVFDNITADTIKLYGKLCWFADVQKLDCEEGDGLTQLTYNDFAKQFGLQVNYHVTVTDI